jgi:hypothetical protein
MTQQEIQERNKQIVLMLGGEYRRNESLSFEPKGRWYIPQFPDAQQDYNLKFHSDWNWLMEAVEFIANYYSDKEIPSVHLLNMPIFAPKEAVFFAVSDFAKLYNENKL